MGHVRDVPVVEAPPTPVAGAAVAGYVVAALVAVVLGFAGVSWWHATVPTQRQVLTAQLSADFQGREAQLPHAALVGPIVLGVIAGLVVLFTVLHAVIRSASRRPLPV